MRRKSFADHADDSVRWTGVPTLVEALHKGDDAQRRRLRWPVAALALAAGGSWLWLTGPRPQFAGPMLYAGGFLIAVMLPVFGPVKPWGSLTLDEYDRELRRSALLFAYTSCTVFALIAFVLIGMWHREGATERQLGYALSLSAGWLLILQGALPTLWASWRNAPPPVD